MKLHLTFSGLAKIASPIFMSVLEQIIRLFFRLFVWYQALLLHYFGRNNFSVMPLYIHVNKHLHSLGGIYLSTYLSTLFHFESFYQTFIFLEAFYVTCKLGLLYCTASIIITFCLVARHIPERWIECREFLKQVEETNTNCF